MLLETWAQDGCYRRDPATTFARRVLGVARFYARGMKRVGEFN